MTNPSISVVKPDVLNENKQTINSFLRETYSQAKAHWQDSISFFKDEFRGMYQQVESCFTNNIVLPVNNYLKDHAEIDMELMQEALNPPEIITGNIVPIQIALQSPMEENY